jgi:hypothetical protein
MIEPSSFLNDLIFMENPVLMKQSHKKTRLDVIVIRGYFLLSKTPCENSCTPEPAMSPVIPHFPHPPNFRGHNFRKMRNRAGIIQRFPTGTDEVEYSNVTVTESKDGMWFGTRAGTGRGIFQDPLREASGIKRNSTEQRF